MKNSKPKVTRKPTARTVTYASSENHQEEAKAFYKEITGNVSPPIADVTRRTDGNNLLIRFDELNDKMYELTEKLRDVARRIYDSPNMDDSRQLVNVADDQAGFVPDLHTRLTRLEYNIDHAWGSLARLTEFI